MQQAFALSNRGFMYRAPTLTADSEPATLANGDAPGGLWTPTAFDRQWWERLPQSDNPLHGVEVADGIETLTGSGGARRVR